MHFEQPLPHGFWGENTLDLQENPHAGSYTTEIKNSLLLIEMNV